MNKLNKKEEEIKNILGGLEIDIDTNDIWANIESELPQPKKKNRFGIFLLFGIIGLGLMGALWNINASNQTEINNQNINVSSNDTNGKTIALVNESNEKSTIVSSTNTKDSTQEINTNNKFSTIENEFSNSTQSKPSTTKSTSAKVINIAETKSSLITTKNRNQIITAYNNVETREESKINTSIIKTESNEGFDLKSLDTRSDIAEMNLTPTLSSKLLDIAQRQRVESALSKIIPLQNNGRQLLLQFKLGANQNRTTIENINSTGEFDESEFDFERDRIGISGTFNIGVENNGWRFLAGVSYHHHVSTYERDDVQIVPDQKTGVVQYKIASDGSTSTQNGTVTVNSVRENKISFHRQHRAIDFHATIGKRLWSFKGFVLMADAGFGINTRTHSSGYYLEDKAFGFTTIENGNDPYNINTHWNAIASMELGYDFGKTRIGLSPFIRYNPNSITSQTHLYSLKNSQVGMQLSLTYSPTRE